MSRMIRIFAWMKQRRNEISAEGHHVGALSFDRIESFPCVRVSTLFAGNHCLRGTV